MSEKLEKARLYEIEEAKNIPQEEKPAFHVSAPVGWINDPNGFSVFTSIILTAVTGALCTGATV